MKIPNLQEYAMTYLARYNNTEKGLTRVLKAKLRRWAMRAEQDGMEINEIQNIVRENEQQISQVIEKIKKIGAINDHLFAESKVNTLIRSGGSKKVIQNKLLQKGVDSDVIQKVLEQYQDKDLELLAALIFAQKKRVGPFRRIDCEFNGDVKKKEQYSMARGGFSFSSSNKVLRMGHAEAEELMQTLKAL